jgi:hypothetical protein
MLSRCRTEVAGRRGRRAELGGRGPGARGAQEPLWFEGRDLEPGVATRCRGQAIADLDVLPLRVDAGLARDPAVIEAVPAVPAGAVTAHLHEPWPDLGWWRVDRRRHRGAAVAARNQVCARIGGCHFCIRCTPPAQPGTKQRPVSAPGYQSDKERSLASTRHPGSVFPAAGRRDPERSARGERGTTHHRWRSFGVRLLLTRAGSAGVLVSEMVSRRGASTGQSSSPSRAARFHGFHETAGLEGSRHGCC